MSLFNRLLRLICNGRTQLEDFHTEIVAQVLQNSPELTLRWLARCGFSGCDKPDEVKVTIRTQEEFAPLETHEDLGSRPDISIRISRGDLTQLIFVESKIGSKEGHREGLKPQLKRYADHLKHRSGKANRGGLLYITRDFDPKEEEPGDPEIIKFCQRRWYDFYLFLKEEMQPSDLTKQLILFMEENNMSQSRQFTALDILALANFRKARKIMDATMWESVSEIFERVCGGVSSSKKAMNQLEGDERYYMFVEHAGLWILLGYSLEGDPVSGYPNVFVNVEVDPKAPARAQILAAARDYVSFKKGKWKEAVADERDWACIYNTESLQNFLSEGDHIKKITEHFMGLLNDIDEFRKRYPNLPWRAQPKGNDDDERTESGTAKPLA